jgi:membrane protein implicated in regulation of membrane protease activity
LDTWFRFLVKQTLENVPAGQRDYLWYKFNIFTRWIPSTNQTIVLVFDPRLAVKERLPSPLLDSLDPSDFSDPYWIHTLFAEEVVRLQDNAVWSIRNLVRKTEIERTTSTKPDPNYPRLHDIARHAIHVSETLDLAVKTIDCMITQHDQFLADRPGLDDKTKTTQRQIRKRMNFYDHLLGSLRSRSASNKERLLNEIHLAFNTVAQYDSRISVEIGRAAQSDSSAMKTIAFLTLTFFPAAFVSAIFSTSFFNYNPANDQWTVSKKFWIYWVVAIPVTCVTALLWLLWHKFFPPKQIADEDLQPRGAHLAGEEMKVKVMATKLRVGVEDGYITGKV